MFMIHKCEGLLSQVSLSRDNLDLLDKRRYWVTWKADGTRYLLLITTMGTYLIDRSFNVRRVQA
jgi:mRNA-capping enzyme